MAEYIDRGELLKELERFPHLGTAGSIVRGMKKADVAPVVRCKDCKHLNALHRMGEIRTEAVKEFAEMVKEKIRTMSRIVVYDEDIDNLVKEFTEEQK